MITYQVTAEVEPATAAEYVSYLRDRHVPDVLATGCFAGAALERLAPGTYRVRYLAHTRAALDRYLAEHAPALRAAAAAHAPPGVQLSRAVWEELASFSAP